MFKESVEITNKSTRNLTNIQNTLLHKKLYNLNIGYKLLKQLRKIINELLHCNAYSYSNLEKSIKKLESLGATNETLALVSLSSDVKKKLQKNLNMI